MRSAPDLARPSRASRELRVASAFLAGRFTSPVGLLLQTVLLSRLLEGGRFPAYLQMYAAAVIVAGVADLGQRHLLFGALTVPDPAPSRALYERARQLTQIGAVGVGALAAVAIAAGADVGASVVVAALACTFAPGDPACVTLRATGDAAREATLLLVEQLSVIVVLVTATAVGADMTPVTAGATVALLALARSIAARSVVRKRLPPLGHVVAPTFDWRVIAGVTLSVVVSETFVRLPLYSVEAAMDASHYAVFAGLYLIFCRGGLVSTSLIQAARTSSSAVARWLSRTTIGPATVGAAVGAAVLACSVPPVQDLTVRVLLGVERLDGSGAAVPAALLATALLVAGGVRTRLQLDGRGTGITLVTAAAAVPHGAAVLIDASTPAIAALVVASTAVYTVGTLVLCARLPGGRTA